MELADRSKLGKGEKDVRSAERKKASLHVRIGMKEKQKSRDAKQLEEVRVFPLHPSYLFSEFTDVLQNKSYRPIGEERRELSPRIKEAV